MKKLIYIFSAIAVVLLIACSAITVKEKANNEKLVFDLANKLSSNLHYNKQDLNDEFSKKVFDAFLENIDPNKRFLIQEDVDKLSAFKFKIDDELKAKELTLFSVYADLISKREAESEKLILKLTAQPFDLTIKDSSSACILFTFSLIKYSKRSAKSLLSTL